MNGIVKSNYRTFYGIDIAFNNSYRRSLGTYNLGLFCERINLNMNSILNIPLLIDENLEIMFLDENYLLCLRMRLRLDLDCMIKSNKLELRQETTKISRKRTNQSSRINVLEEQKASVTGQWPRL